MAAHYLLAQLYMQDIFSADDDSNDGKPSFEEEGFDDSFANEAEDFTRASDDEKVRFQPFCSCVIKFKVSLRATLSLAEYV